MFFTCFKGECRNDAAFYAEKFPNKKLCRHCWVVVKVSGCCYDDILGFINAGTAKLTSHLQLFPAGAFQESQAAPCSGGIRHTSVSEEIVVNFKVVEVDISQQDWIQGGPREAQAPPPMSEPL